MATDEETKTKDTIAEADAERSGCCKVANVAGINCTMAETKTNGKFAYQCHDFKVYLAVNICITTVFEGVSGALPGL